MNIYDNAKTEEIENICNKVDLNSAQIEEIVNGIIELAVFDCSSFTFIPSLRLAIIMPPPILRNQ